MKTFYLLLILFLFNACVPYKNIVYLQGEANTSGDFPIEYKIKKDDILYIDIKSGNPEIQKFFNSAKTGTTQTNAGNLFFSGYTVDSKGQIELPVVGKITVENKTFEEVKRQIKEALLKSQFSSLDDVFIKVKLAGVPFSIVGEVNTPQNGIIYKTNPNIFDVIASAGDIKITGDHKNVIIIRESEGKKIQKKIDLTDANILYSDFYYIRPNDLVYVKPLKQKTLGTGSTLSQTISTTITALSLISSVILITNYIKN
jgi:polysaccharide export outer membrane protein